MPETRKRNAREDMAHHLEAASACAEEADEKEVQAKIDELIRLLQRWGKLPKPP